MLKTVLIVLMLVAVSVLLLSVRLWFGRRFVHTHIDGHRALNRRGIRCVKEMDRQARQTNKRRVSEKSESIKVKH